MREVILALNMCALLILLLDGPLKGNLERLFIGVAADLVNSSGNVENVAQDILSTDLLILLL